MNPIAVLIHVPNVESGLDWYGKAFPSALVIETGSDELAILDIDGFRIEIVRADAKVASGKCGSVLYWSVPDIEEALERLIRIGAMRYRGPMHIENGSGMCQVEDPFGNLVGLRGRWRHDSDRSTRYRPPGSPSNR